MAAFGGPIPRGGGRRATLGKVLIFVSKNSQGLVTRSENSTYSIHIHKPTSLWAFPLKEQQHHSKPDTGPSITHRLPRGPADAAIYFPSRSISKTAVPRWRVVATV